MEKYLVVIEKAKNKLFGIFAGCMGCVATGNSVEETLVQIKDALQIHLESMSNDGEDMPKANGISQHILDAVFKEGEICR